MNPLLLALGAMFMQQTFVSIVRTLPAVIATDWPGFTVWPRFSLDSSAATVLAIWSTGRVGDSNDWRTRKVRGYCDIMVVDKRAERFTPDYTQGEVNYRKQASHRC